MLSRKVGFAILVTFVLLQAMISRTTAQQQQQQDVVMGSCTFMNQWTGETCMEFHGDGWTQASVEERCGMETDSSLGESGCPKSDEGFAGFCSMASESIAAGSTASSRIEATAMMITPTSDCSFNAMACGSFMGGTFDPSPACAAAEESAAVSSAPNEAPPMDGSWGGGGASSSSQETTNTACDTSPGALTKALSKLLNEKSAAAATTKTIEDEDHYSRVVDHMCIDSTGYAGKRCFYTYIPECATADSPLV